MKRDKTSKFYYIGRIVPIQLFKDISLWSSPDELCFAINQCTVLMHEKDNTMEVMYFGLNKEFKKDTYLLPENKEELIKRLKHTCGDKLIEDQIIKY